VALAAALVAGMASGAPAPAEACHNGVLYDLDADVRAVSRAERLVDRGRAHLAMRVADAALTRMRRHGGRSAAGAMKRAHVVVAVAVVRANGRVDLQRRRVVRRTSEPQRLSNLRWARDQLTRLGRGENDPVMDARRAEALGRLPDGTDEARRVLGRLAEADLMPDAWAWRALADVLRREGDDVGAARAMATCERRAGRLSSRICHLPES